MCARKDSNLHVVRHQILSLARLPITPRARLDCKFNKKIGNSQNYFRQDGIFRPAEKPFAAVHTKKSVWKRL